MKRLYSVLADDLEHCIITGSSNVAIHHVFNGANRKLSEKIWVSGAAPPGLAQYDAVQCPHGPEV